MPFTTQLEPMGARAGANVGAFLLGMATDYVAKADKAKEQQASDAKLAKSLRSVMGELYPEEKSKWDTMGLQDLQGTLEGRTAQKAREKEAAAIAQMQEQTRQMQFNRGERAAEQQDIAGALRGMQAMNAPQAGGGASVMGLPAMMTTPAQNPNQMGAILSRLSAQFPRAAATLREEVKQQMELRQQAGPRATPGTIQRIPGMDSHVFGVQSPSGAGSFLPVGGGQGGPAGARPATARDQLTAQRQIRELEKELETLFTIAPENFTAAHRVQGENLKRQIAELRRIAGLAQPDQAGGAKEALASGSADDPLGIFQ